VYPDLFQLTHFREPDFIRAGKEGGKKGKEKKKQEISRKKEQRGIIGFL